MKPARTDQECMVIICKEWPEFVPTALQTVRDGKPLEELLNALESFG